MKYLVICMLVLIGGCTSFEYQPDGDRVTYLAAKSASYLLLRSETIALEDAKRLEPHLGALYAALEATDEEELDIALGMYLKRWTAILPHEGDCVLAGELIDDALQAISLRDPSILSSTGKQYALRLIGGILDGIALAEKVAARAL